MLHFYFGILILTACHISKNRDCSFKWWATKCSSHEIISLSYFGLWNCCSIFIFIIMLLVFSFCLYNTYTKVFHICCLMFCKGWWGNGVEKSHLSSVFDQRIWPSHPNGRLLFSSVRLIYCIYYDGHFKIQEQFSLCEL